MLTKILKIGETLMPGVLFLLVIGCWLLMQASAWFGLLFGAVVYTICSFAAPRVNQYIKEVHEVATKDPLDFTGSQDDE